MKLVRVLAIALAVWVGVALSFDGLIGLFQPGADVLRTFDEQGRPHDTHLSVLDDGDTVWVESGHHFRGWLHRIEKNPDVELTRNGVSKRYRAVILDDPATRAHLVELMKQRVGGAGFWATRALLLFAEIEPIRLDPREEAPRQTAQ